MCQGCYKQWRKDERRRDRFTVAFLSNGQLYLNSDALPTPYILDGGGKFALDGQIYIGGCLFWVGAAHTAPIIGPHGLRGQYFRLYPQVE